MSKDLSRGIIPISLLLFSLALSYYFLVYLPRNSEQKLRKEAIEYCDKYQKTINNAISENANMLCRDVWQATLDNQAYAECVNQKGMELLQQYPDINTCINLYIKSIKSK